MGCEEGLISPNDVVQCLVEKDQRTNRWNKGLISADRSTRTTLIAYNTPFLI